MRLLFILVFVLGFSFVASASNYKINPTALNQKFECAIEVSLFDSHYFDNTQQNLESRNINQNVAGILSICCGSFGLHRFYLGHTEAGLKHLAVGVSIVALLGVSFVGANASSSGPTNIADAWTLLSIAAYGLAYCGTTVNGLYNLVEGIMYLTMPEEKFQGKIAKDPRFFAAFSRN